MQLKDPRLNIDESISDDTTKTPPETFPCPSDPSQYTNGVNQRTETNSATLTGPNTDKEAHDSVDITCNLPPLSAQKDATGTFDRKIEWKLSKSASPTSFTGQAGQVAGSTTWTVNADKTVTDGNYQVTGTIMITNPAAIPQSFDVSDALDDSTIANVDCDANTTGDQTTGTIPAGDKVTCSYTASPNDGSATKNTATVKAVGNADQTATADVLFTPNVIGDDTVTLGDPHLNISESISDDTTKTPTEQFTCPTAGQANYVNGQYQFTVPNTATLTGPNTNLSANANVTVTCYVQFGKTMGFWGNTNGQALLAANSAFSSANAVTLGGETGCSLLVDSAAKSKTILPNTLNGTSLISDCDATNERDTGINLGSLNTLLAQTLAISYNIKYVTTANGNYAGQTIAGLGCTASAAGTGLSGTSTVEQARDTANGLIKNAQKNNGTSTVTQAQIGAMNTLLGCLNREA